MTYLYVSFYRESMQKMLSRGAFISTIRIPTEIGACPVRSSEERPVPQVKSKATGVVHEHKKYLQQLAHEKQQEKQDAEERAQKKEDLKRRLAEKALAQHESIRAIKESDVSDEEKQRQIASVIVSDAKKTQETSAVAQRERDGTS